MISETLAAIILRRGNTKATTLLTIKPAEVSNPNYFVIIYYWLLFRDLRGFNIAFYMILLECESDRSHSNVHYLSVQIINLIISL